MSLNEEEKNLELNKKRHSMSHVLAAAVKELFPDVKIGMGPAIDNGFYYDFDSSHVFTEEDFSKIEDAMNKVLASNQDFARKEVTKKEAITLFKNEPYKLEIINDLPDDAVITTYQTGNFIDLCKGPHVENTKFLRSFAFKVNRVSGAYWKGSEKNKMLQRIYVYGFDNKQELKDYLKLLEEAERRDHRKLGKELGLFFISPYAPGMPFFMPKGVTIKNELIKLWRELHKEAGYIELETPLTLSRELWHKSGHWAHYEKNMYAFKVEEEDFAIKPMNCPGGMLAYMEGMHSYKELPIRAGELGKVHRHEASGTLHGLFRVRCFTQDDAHIFMLPSQIEDEVRGVLDLVDKTYSLFGLSYHLELSTMPENHMGELKDWEFAETCLKNALEKLGRGYVINPGDGAFYGPKIDIHIKDAIGRTWQCGTIQLDMQMPKRFNLEYTDSDGSKKEPIMIHRVIFGSIERFMGILIEHYAGAFPLWLSPVQVAVMNITSNTEEYAKKVQEELLAAGIRAELDTRNESLNKKIREAQVNKVSYMLIIGDKEKDENKVSVRHRKQGDMGTMSVKDVVKQLTEEIAKRA